MGVMDPDDSPDGDLYYDRYEDLRDELNWDEAQAEMIESVRDEALTLEAQEMVKAAFGAMNLDFFDGETVEIIEKQVLQFIDQTSRNDESSKPDLTEDQWDEIQEQESLAQDDRLELDAIRKQAEFAAALVKLKNPFASDSDHYEAQFRQEEAEKALQDFQDRRTRRQNHEALQYEIVKAVKEKAWTREEFAEQADISLSTVRNLMVSTDPDRRWRVQIQRSVEDALGWSRGSFASILETGQFPDARKATELSGTFPIEPRLRDQLESIAIREERNVNAILEDALRVYLKVYGPPA